MTPTESSPAALTDERLMAYADDRLPPAEAAQVRARLSGDDEARRRVEAFRQASRHLRVLDDTLHEPLPDRLEALRDELLSTPGPAPRARHAPGTLSWLPRLLPWGRAAAAGLAGLFLGVLLGLLGARLAGPATDGSAGQADAWASLPAEVLDTATSGNPVVVDDAGGRRTITPFATIALAAGGHCREYTDQAGGADLTWRVLACRDAGGRWQPRVVLSESTPAAGGSGYRPASAGLAEFDALVERAAPGRILTPDEEADWLGRR